MNNFVFMIGGSPLFHPFIIYTHYITINDSGLFAWISLTALSQTFYYTKRKHAYCDPNPPLYSTLL